MADMEAVMIEATTAAEEIPMESEYSAEDLAMYGPAPWSEEKAEWYAANIAWTVMALMHSGYSISTILKLGDYSTYDQNLQYVYMFLSYGSSAFWTVGALTQILSMFFIAVEINLMWWMEIGMFIGLAMEAASLFLWYLYDGYKVLCNTDSATNATQCAWAAQLEEDSAFAMASEAFTGVVIMQLSKDWFDGQWDMLPIDTKKRIVAEKQEAMQEKKEEMKEEWSEEMEDMDLDMTMGEMFRYFVF